MEKWEFECCIHGLKSAIILINSYYEILMHLSPTRYKVTDISVCVLTLLYFSVQPHSCRMLCPPSVYLFFMVSLKAIMLCLVLTVPGGWDQSWGKHKRAGEKQWQKGKFCWILGKPAPDSFLKSKCELPAASLCLAWGFSITELILPLCPPFLRVAPGVPSITWILTLMKTDWGRGE